MSEQAIPRAFYACEHCQSDLNCHAAEDMLWSEVRKEWLCETCWCDLTVDEERVTLASAIPDPSALRDQLTMAGALISGKAKWLAFGTMDGRGEVAIDGLRYCTKLDANGIPEAHSVIRAALAKMKGAA